MNWHYLRGQAAEFWEGDCSDGIPAALSRLIPTAETYCYQDSVTGRSQDSPSGMTYGHLKGAHGGVQLTLSLEGSPAKISAQRVKVADLPGPVRDYGSKCSELLEKLNLVLSSRKTVRSCVPVDSAPSSKDLPAWGMTCDGACWELGTSVRLISENGCGYWPTPVADDAVNRKKGKWNSRGEPKLSAAVQLWPTPTKSDGMGGPGRGKAKQGGDNLRTAAGGRLNPPWVELLMGWPKGFTCIDPINVLSFNEWLMGFKGEDNAEEKRCKKEVPILRENDGAEILRKTAGGLGGVDQEEVLQFNMFKYSQEYIEIGVALAGKKASEEELRVLWNRHKTPGSSCGWELEKYGVMEFANFVCLVSSVYPSYGKEAWSKGTWEASVPRGATGVKNRVNRLKAIGNGQVPRVAATAWRVLNGC